MFILFIERKGDIHIIELSNNGKYYTSCGQILEKSDKGNTLAYDNVTDNICPNCHISYSGYSNDMDMSRMSKMQIDIFRVLKFHKSEMYGPKSDFSRVFTRKWHKMNNLKKCLSRDKRGYNEKIK